MIFFLLYSEEPSSDEGEDLDVGTTVLKMFNGDPFRGHIESIDTDKKSGRRLYHIVYEDGDEEDLHHNECVSILVDS